MANTHAHQSRIGGLIVDCLTDDLPAAAAFWAGLTGYEPKPDPKYPEYILLETPAGEPKMLVQKVDHPSRIHLDIETSDKDAEARRLEELGARRIAEIKSWIVMEAPTGHRFCLVGPQRPDFETNATTWDAN